MQKELTLIAIHSMIVVPILVFSLATAQPSNNFPLPEGNPLLSDPTGISNFQVHSACNDAVNSDNEVARKMGQFVCRMTQDMAYEHNNYHQYFVRYFTEKEMEEGLYYIEGYSVTGCDISELSRGDFA